MQIMKMVIPDIDEEPWLIAREDGTLEKFFGDKIPIGTFNQLLDGTPASIENVKAWSTLCKLEIPRIKHPRPGESESYCKATLIQSIWTHMGSVLGPLWHVHPPEDYSELWYWRNVQTECQRVFNGSLIYWNLQFDYHVPKEWSFRPDPELQSQLDKKVKDRS